MKAALKILLAIIICVALAGCQPTPDKPVVIQKDLEQMINTATMNTDGKTLFEMVNPPDRMQLSLQDGSGNVTINANAEIIVPEAQGMSTLRVKKHEFSQAEADRVLQYFIGENLFNDSYDGENDVFIEMLMLFQAQLAAETDPEKRAQLQASIDKIKMAGIDAEGGQDIVPASKVFSERKPSGMCIEGYSETLDGNRYLQIVNNSDMNEYHTLYTSERTGYSTQPGTYWDEHTFGNMSKIGLDPETVSHMPLSITAEHAKEIAAQALCELGLEEMTLAFCGEVWGGTFITGGVVQGRHAFRLEYVRQVGGVPITYSELGIESGALFETNDGDYAARWPYECVHFIIDDTGIAEFVWESPYEISETVTEHSYILPFEDIQGVFVKMMPITNAYTGGDSIKMTFDIASVKLGLMRITEKNSTDTALPIPVWDFFGTVIIQDGNEEPVAFQNTATSRLTINAIDGSVIDRSSGY